MKKMMGLVLLGSLTAFGAPALGGAAAEPKLIHKDGILRVFEQSDFDSQKGKGQPYYYLMKIDVHFGLQFLKPKDPDAVGNPDKDFSTRPTCYVHDRSPVGIVMATLKAKAVRPPFAVVGMHVGTMAAYARPGQEVHFFENNPKIIALSLPKKANPYFTYIQDAKKRGAKVRVFQGKERATLAQKAPPKFYQVMVVEMCLRERLEDACVELMTKEGMSLLMDKLTDTGILCYHVSNRYLDMTPVLADVAKDLGLAVRHSHDPAPDNELNNTAHFSSEWVMVARKKELLATLQPPPNYQEIIKEVIATKPYREYELNKPFWDEPQSTGRHVWTDKSHHSLKGLMRNDPAVSRLGTVLSHLVTAGIKLHGTNLDKKTTEAFINFRNQMPAGLYSVGRVVAQLRAEFDWTFEDLQKGWRERQ